MLKNERLNFN